MTTVQEPVTLAVSREVAEHVTVRLRETLEDARGMLVSAWRGRVWEPLGYADWHDYLLAELGDLLTVCLPPALARVANAKWRRAAALVRARGEQGLTCLELEEATGWGHGSASPALWSAERKGFVRRVEVFRLGYAVYVA